MVTFNITYNDDADSVGEDRGSMSDILESEEDGSCLVDSDDNLSIITSTSSEDATPKLYCLAAPLPFFLFQHLKYLI
jgi:hypothetical protein